MALRPLPKKRKHLYIPGILSFFHTFSYRHGNPVLFAHEKKVINPTLRPAKFKEKDPKFGNSTRPKSGQGRTRKERRKFTKERKVPNRVNARISCSSPSLRRWLMCGAMWVRAANVAPDPNRKRILCEKPLVREQKNADTRQWNATTAADPA